MIERLDGLIPNSPHISTGGVQAPSSTSSEPDFVFKKTGENVQQAQKQSDTVQLGNERPLREMERAAEEEREKATDEDILLEKTIVRLNERMNLLNRQLLFRLDERIGRNYISIIDKETKETIKEFPPEEIRNFIAQMIEFEKRMQAGGESDRMAELMVNVEV